jgi:hypothetical protein
MTIKPYYVNLFLSALSLIYKDLISIHSHNSGKKGKDTCWAFGMLRSGCPGKQRKGTGYGAEKSALASKKSAESQN